MSNDDLAVKRTLSSEEYPTWKLTAQCMFT